MDMTKDIRFDTLIVVTPNDCERLLSFYPRFLDNMPYGNIRFIGSEKVFEIAKTNESIRKRISWTDENDLILFDDVYNLMSERLKEVLNGEKLARAAAGWYYQQFLKMQYAYVCEDEYYMVWDGDTVPCRKINMFSAETGQPYLDLKHEYHPHIHRRTAS